MLGGGGAASRGTCPTWVQCARRRPAVMAAQEGGGESTGGATRLGARATRDARGGAGKAGRAVRGCGVAACTARRGEPVRVRGPRGLLGAAGCTAEGGGARARAGSRERPGRARGAEAGLARPSNAQGRAGAGQRRGRREREGGREKEKKIGNEKEKWRKTEKGKRERYARRRSRRRPRLHAHARWSGVARRSAVRDAWNRKKSGTRQRLISGVGAELRGDRFRVQRIRKVLKSTMEKKYFCA